MSNLLAVILAAGKGTRMKSALPKVLHNVGGKAMVQHVLDAAKTAGAERSVVVVGFGAERVTHALQAQAEFVVQAEQLGTGHAVVQTKQLLHDFNGTVMVLCGDTPLLQADLLKRLYDGHIENRAVATVLTARMPNPTGYGRVIRDASGSVTKIVEDKDANPTERLVDEINTGIYCFEKDALFAALDGLTCDNAQGEYYLTDVIDILAGNQAAIWAVEAGDYQATLGINSRAQLAEAEKILRRRKLQQLMDDGVTIMDVDSTFIDDSVVIGSDTVIYPFTWIEGNSVIGQNCQIGPNTRICDTEVGHGVTLHFVYSNQCSIADHVTVGPYAHLRPGTKLATGVKVGNFVEVKNSQVGANSKIPHLSYIGDSDVGQKVNIGSGSITVNYDGAKKHRTVIEDGAFVGCNSNLVAPVTVGQGSYVAAGSTITKDVPAAALGVGRARQSNIEGWTARKR